MRPPTVRIVQGQEFTKADWKENGGTKAFWFVVYAKDKTGWSYSVLPASATSIALSSDRKVEKVVVTSVDRLGNESPVR
jgi:hypothetical protein